MLLTDFLRRICDVPELSVLSGFVSLDHCLEGDGESFLGGETRGCALVGLKGLWLGCLSVEFCVAPPRTKPFPLNGIKFLMS